MGSVEGVLARIGGDASLRYASAETLAVLLRDEGVLPDLAQISRGNAVPAVWFVTQMPVHPDREDDDPFDDDHGDHDDDDGGSDEPLTPLPHPGAPRSRP